MKIRATIVVEWDVGDISQYPGCKTAADAVVFTQKQFDDGDIGVEDVADWGPAACRFEGIEDAEAKR